MVSTLNLAIGVFCIVTGILWVIKPVAMSDLQRRLLYFGSGDSDEDEFEHRALIGRVTGGLLAILGVWVIVAQ